MTASLDFDRMLSDILEVDGPQAVPLGLVDAALDQARRVPQRSADVRRSGRSGLLVAATVAALLAVVAGVMTLGSAEVDPSPSPRLPTPPPSPAGPVLPPAVAMAPALRSAWLAPNPGIAGLGNTDPDLRLLVAVDGTTLRVQTNTFGNETLASRATATDGDEVTLVTTDRGVGCEIGDEGRYRWQRSPDGVQLTLSPVADQCATRAATLGRAWTRTVDVASTGGRGLIAVSDPPLLVTLPDGPFIADRATDSAEITSAALDRTFLALRDPWGLEDPCSVEGQKGAPYPKVPIDPTIDAMVAYLDDLPGWAVTRTDLEIDGRPAAQIDITSSPTADCPGGRVDAWAAKAFTSDRLWSFVQGQSARVHLVEVGPDLFLLRWSGGDVTTDEERDVMSTVRFLEPRPSPT